MQMVFKRTRKAKRSYDLFASYSYYLPGPGGMTVLLAWLLAGALIANLLVYILNIFLQGTSFEEYYTLISYPVMFIPAMIYSSRKSRMNELKSPGYALDSSNFGKTGGVLMAIMAAISTIACGFIIDPISLLMPPPEWFRDLMENLLVDSPLWVTLLSVSVMAPIFEEWLCRGMVLRGLLRSRMKPVYAMLISSLFFAVIHMNPWQAIPAFVLGMLFAYVYYRTGSLKLTMLMHCVNNTFSVILSQRQGMTEIDSYSQIMETWQYITLIAASILIVVIFIDIVRKTIPLQDTKGNCDLISIDPLNTDRHESFR